MFFLKKTKIFNSKIFFALSIIFLILVDQGIKALVVTNMELYDSIPIINNVIHITYVLNDGAAFSSMAGQVWLLCGVTSIIMIALLVILFVKKLPHPLLNCAFVLIIAGGIGNLIDRIFRGNSLFHGEVVDFVDFRLIHFAVFNFADSIIVIGTFLIIYYLLFIDMKKNKPIRSEEISNE